MIPVSDLSEAQANRMGYRPLTTAYDIGAPTGTRMCANVVADLKRDPRIEWAVVPCGDNRRVVQVWRKGMTRAEDFELMLAKRTANILRERGAL